MHNVPIYKIVATVGGVALTGAAVWMNAEHVIHAEGQFSPLVLASIIVTVCAASAPPFAERAWQSGEFAKSVMIWLFFVVTVAFSLTTSIARSSEYAGGKVAEAESSNKAAQLAEEGYEALKKSAEAECKKRGPNCRKLEDRRDEARKALVNAAPTRTVDPGAERLAAVLGIDMASVQLYSPLLLPLSLEFGGFIFLAFGLAPARRRKEAREDLASVANPVQAAAMPMQEDANELQSVASPVKPVALAIANEETSAKAGTRSYYLQRLEREFPAIARRVHAGKISVFAGCVEAGIRKQPKARTWDANEYVSA